MNINNQGFTILELASVTAVTAVLAAIAMGGYQYYVPKAQAFESAEMIHIERMIAIEAIKSGKCSPRTVQGKYGSIAHSGTFNVVIGQTCPSGCKIRYTFKDSDVHGAVKGKIVDVDVLNNGQVSLTNETNLNAKYIPGTLISRTVSSSDNCTSVTNTAPAITGGSNLNQTEQGDAPPPPPPGGTTTPPLEGTTPPPAPSTGSTVNLGSRPDLVVNVVDGYKVIPSIKLPDLVGVNPGPGTKIEIPSDTAIVGFTDGSLGGVAPGAVIIPPGFPAGNVVIINKGVIAGGGGDGGGWRNSRCQGGGSGGTGIYNQTAIQLVIENHGVIAGGGGGGGCGLRGGVGGYSIGSGGGGAPFGKGLQGSGSASLLNAGGGKSFGGGGGGIGLRGTDGRTNDNGLGNFSGGSAGLRTMGPVQVVAK